MLSAWKSEKKFAQNVSLMFTYASTSGSTLNLSVLYHWSSFDFSVRWSRTGAAIQVAEHSKASDPMWTVEHIEKVLYSSDLFRRNAKIKIPEVMRSFENWSWNQLLVFMTRQGEWRVRSCVLSWRSKNYLLNSWPNQRQRAVKGTMVPDPSVTDRRGERSGKQYHQKVAWPTRFLLT